jgi:dienelactone hydrolase
MKQQERVEEVLMEDRILARRRPLSGLTKVGISLFSAILMSWTCGAQQAPAPRIVDLTAADGVKLKATYFAAAKAGAAVLLLHQCNQQRKNWDDLAARMAAAGINVLTLDYRGYGESGGSPARDLPGPEFAKLVAEKWPGDVDTAFSYLLSQPGVTRSIVGVGGASCGVNQSIQVARRHPEVKSLVLLSGNSDRDGREFLRKSQKLPVFFSAADDDDGAVELMQWLYDLSPNPGNRFEHYSSGGHGTVMFAAHKELPGMIVDWYVQTLVKTPGSTPQASGVAGRAEHHQSILDLIDSPGGTSKVAQQLAEARKRDSKANLFSEGIVNAIGYEHLQSGDTKGAVEILKLNATAYPKSPNSYDSLSDAYLADGQKDAARENAKKALELLASDTTDPETQRQLIRESAEGKLKQLETPPQ